MQTDIIIYSKDRACQVDLLLKSIDKFVKHVGKIVILYDYSNEQFAEAYWKLKDCIMIRQTPEIFKRELIHSTCFTNHSKYVMPLCDDDVFINPCDVSTIDIENDVVGINLRYSPNVNISYHDGNFIPNPVFESLADDVLKWNWTLNNPRYCWGYPYQAGSVVYDYEFFQQMVNLLSYHLPSTLETAMNYNKFVFNKPFLKCFNKSKLINVSINRIDNTYSNRAGREFSYSAEHLNDMFLQGKSINLDQVVKTCNEQNSCDFIELPLELN